MSVNRVRMKPMMKKLKPGLAPALGIFAGHLATPATYQVGGRQFVVIAAWGGKHGGASGGKYVAFALPQNK